MKVLTVFFLHIRSLLRVYSYLQPTVIILIVKVIIKHSDYHKSDNNSVVFFILISIFYSPIRIGKRNNVPLESVQLLLDNKLVRFSFWSNKNYFVTL